MSLNFEDARSVTGTSDDGREFSRSSAWSLEETTPVEETNIDDAVIIGRSLGGLSPSNKSARFN